jgi:hypothetical protein
MRITSAVATATLHADSSSDAAASAEHPVASATEHAEVSSNPFAVLGEPLFRAGADFKHVQSQVASAVSGSNESNPQQVAKRHGIIVIGGSQDQAAASSARDAIMHGPVLQGIIIVGGSPQVAALPKTAIGDQPLLPASKDLEVQDRMGNFEIQRVMSAFNQAETLASNMQKKSDDTLSDLAKMIG